MDWVLIAVMGLLALICLGAMSVCIYIYAVWRDKRIKALEQDWMGMLDVMEDFMAVQDRETSQLWEYVLSPQHDQSRSGPK